MHYIVLRADALVKRVHICPRNHAEMRRKCRPVMYAVPGTVEISRMSPEATEARYCSAMVSVAIVCLPYVLSRRGSAL